MKHLELVLLSALLVAGKIYAQSAGTAQDTLKLSLQDAWQRAEAHSRTVTIKKKIAGIAAEEVRDVQTDRYPELGIMGSIEKATNIPIYENGLLSKPVQHEVIHTLYKVAADFYLNIYNGNKLNLKIEEDKTLQQIAHIRVDEAVSDVRYQTASLYLDLQKSYVFRDLIQKDIADQEKQLVEIQSFHKNGTVLKSDVLRVQLDLSKRKLTLVQIENDILIASQKLNIILGQPDETVILPDKPDSGLAATGSYDQWLQEALSHSFAWHISEKQTNLSEIHLREIKANVSPRVGLYGDFYYSNPQIFLYPYNPFWYSLGIAGLKVSFPLSEIYHNMHQARAAKLELEKEEEAHRDITDKIRQQVKEAFLRYKEALVRIEVARANVAQAEENARIVKNTYFNQASLITDLLDADVQVLQTRFELAAAKIMAQNKYYLLQNISGIL